MEVHYSTTGTATCGSPGVVVVSSITQASASKPVLSSWPQNGSNPKAPTTGATWSLSAVTCGQNDGTLQQLSDPRTITFNLTADEPTLTTNQDGPLANATCSQNTGTCGTTGQLPCCCSNGTTPGCAAVSPWENGFNAYLTSTTPGSSICWSDTTTATCTAGTCNANSAASPVTIPVTQSGTTLSWVGCLPGLTSSASDTKQFTLNADQGYAGAGGVASCNASTNVGESQLTADKGLGGPTPNSCVCWTTDSSTPSCQADASGCTGTPTGTTQCVSAGAAGTTQSPAIGLTGTTTFNLISCAQGFNPTTSTQTYSLTPYRTTGIIVDGNLTDWNRGVDTGTTNFLGQLTASGAYGNEAGYTIDMDWYGRATGSGDPFVAGKGMVTYSSTTLYVGVEPSLGNASNFSGQCYTSNGAGGCTPGIDTYIVVYLGDGVKADGAGTDLPSLDTLFGQCDTPGINPNRTIATGAGIKYALLYRSDNGVPAPAAFAWNTGTQTWGTTSLSGITTGYASGTNTTEFGIPLSSLGATAASTVTVMASEIADVGQAGPPPLACGNSDELFRFPLAYPSDPAYYDLYQSFYEVNLASCAAPNTQIVYIP